jgi:hypothetical protein
MINWYGGWCLILAAFLTGALIGLFFHQHDFLGGYGSFRRRILRLGHIALAALGMINILYGLSPHSVTASEHAWIASTGLLVGGVSMPAVCFLSAWRESFRHLFFIPVVALSAAALQIVTAGPP